MNILVSALVHFANLSTIFLCGFMKIPQIQNTVKLKTARGISLLSLLLEFTGYCIMLSYNLYAGYSYGSFLEYPLLVVQDVILLVIVLLFSGLMTPVLAFPAGIYTLFMLCVVKGFLPKALILILVGFCTPIAASSKVVQLASIIRARDSTGLSLLTWLISSYTSLTRVFTIYVESADIALLTNFVISLALNMMIAFSVYFYKNKKVD